MSSNHLENWQSEIESCENLQVLEALRIRLLGKSGEITQKLKELGGLDPDLRRQRGAEINQLKEQVTESLDQKKTILNRSAMANRIQNEKVDVTLPARPETTGTLHPITQTIQELITYFDRLGFQIAEGPEIDDEEHNFNALNIPAHHPARQNHDTFYFNPETTNIPYLLRTQTSNVQIRTMRSHQPPFRILAPGRVYRSDYDATHTPMFHQCEGLIIESGINMRHLKGCLIDFIRHFFGITDLPVRFRPHFFPFTEPSAEVDVGCTRTADGLKIEAGSDWLEILGCGMVHPKVLENCGIDPEEHQGFAFGMGIERLAMLKYGLPDIRAMYESDVRWLNHYGFNPWGGK